MGFAFLGGCQALEHVGSSKKANGAAEQGAKPTPGQSQKLLAPEGTAAGSSQLTAGTAAGATGPPGEGFGETGDVS